MEMTYQDFIQNILNTRGRFACADEYHERHHIIPKCMGGNNEDDNLIDLFAREHFIAHKLLVAEHPDNNKLVLAWTMMAFPRNKDQIRYELSPEEYEEARKAISKAMSGRKLSDETKKKISTARIGQPCSEKAKQRTIEAHKGVHFSEKHKNKLSEAHKGKIFSDEHKENISKGKRGKPLSDAQKAALAIVSEMNKGRKHSDESKAKISIGNKGKVVSQESREKMSASKKGKTPKCAQPKRIGQYDINAGYLLQEFDSVVSASKFIGIDNSYLGKCIKNNKPVRGFIWKYI